MNKPGDTRNAAERIEALAEVDGDTAAERRYVRRPFQREPDFGVTSVNYDLSEFWDRSGAPE